MYPFQIKEMTDAVMATGIGRGLNIHVARAQVQVALTKYWTDQVAITWSVDDIVAAAMRHKRRLPKYKARRILAQLLPGHDGREGVNWDTLALLIDKELNARNNHKRGRPVA